MRAGASAYIFKSAPKDEMLGVIRSARAGKRQVPPAVAARLAEHLGEEGLTSRELDVLSIPPSLPFRGESDLAGIKLLRQIGRELVIKADAGGSKVAAVPRLTTLKETAK